uniref:Putative group II intron reverse transcriptase/maturase protein n=1 Tax=Thorea hispida TaxID=202687 RepID=A0A1Z1XAN1_9FLOR|nr:putative group II intron reverse transcriptase/maturase protein [Thorea hispida]
MAKYNILYPDNLSNTSNLSILYYKLFYIQKKIYVASQKCNNSLVQSLQKLLINSYSIQCLAIYSNGQHCTSLPTKYQQKKILLNKNINQHKIIKACLQQESNNYIAYWCLQPEWLAKKENNELSRVYLFNNYMYKQAYLLNNHKYFKYTYFCAEQSINTSVNHIDINYFISKLQTNTWIQYQVRNLLLQKYLKEFNNNFYLQNTVPLNKIYSNLCILFNQILLTGIEWISLQQNTSEIKQKVNLINIFYIISGYILITTEYKILYLIQAKIINFLYHIRKLEFYNYIHDFVYTLNDEILLSSNRVSLKIHQQDLTKIACISISSKTCKFLLRYMKNFLYHKNKFAYYRFNSYLNYQKINNILNKKLKIIYSNYKNFILNKQFAYINSILSYIIYKWTKKSLTRKYINYYSYINRKLNN